jgi:hypothetical protein
MKRTLARIALVVLFEGYLTILALGTTPEAGSVLKAWAFVHVGLVAFTALGLGIASLCKAASEDA